jgi:hypothetical protein
VIDFDQSGLYLEQLGLVGEDDAGNIYVLAYGSGKEPYRDLYVIVTDPGKWHLATVKLDPPPLQSDPKGYLRLVDIDGSGNIYQLAEGEEGNILVQWRRD